MKDRKDMFEIMKMCHAITLVSVIAPWMHLLKYMKLYT